MSDATALVSLLMLIAGGFAAGLLAVVMLRPLRRNLYYRRLHRRLRQRELQLLLIEPYVLPTQGDAAAGEPPSSR